MSSNVARDAIEVLRTKGWTKGNYSESGKHCAIGALAVAMNEGSNLDIFSYGLVEKSPLAIQVGKIAKEQFPDRTSKGYVTVFNDHEDTTLDDVIMVFEKAAVWIDEQA